ncbi:MAG: PepSY-associated TM helix domain-containing protein [Pseudomonadota bacterium]
MNGGFRQSMTWLHTWAGLVFCWILYFMFVTGTLGYLDAEIDHWMKPEMSSAKPQSTQNQVETAQRYLQANAVGADRWLVVPASGRDEPHLRIFWQMPNPTGEPVEDPESLCGNHLLNVDTGERLLEARDTGGGQVLYRMHYVLHYLDFDIAFRIVGVLTLFMFVAMVSGVIIHKRIFKDLFTFRSHKGQRSWLDMHNLLSVSSLPFQLMITYSGLLFMVVTWMPLIAVGSYGFDIQKATVALTELGGQQAIERSGSEQLVPDLSELVVVAEQEWGSGQVRNINIQFPGDENSLITVNREPGIAALGDRMIFNGVSGEFVESAEAHPNKPIAFASVMIALHEGLFAGWTLRWLYVFSGLLGTAMVATGAIYWVAKRKRQDDQPQSLGYRFVDAINVGTIFGLLIAIASYFLANRLLPLSMESRAEWEVHIMFIAWAICLLHPIFRPIKTAWIEQAWAIALISAAIPVVNAFVTQSNLLQSIGSGDWVMAGFDIAALVTAAVFCLVAIFLHRLARVPAN